MNRRVVERAFLVHMGSLLNISLFIIATVLAVCYVIYSLIVAYQSSVKMSNRYTSSSYSHLPMFKILTYLFKNSLQNWIE